MTHNLCNNSVKLFSMELIYLVMHVWDKLLYTRDGFKYYHFYNPPYNIKNQLKYIGPAVKHGTFVKYSGEFRSVKNFSN